MGKQMLLSKWLYKAFSLVFIALIMIWCVLSLFTCVKEIQNRTDKQGFYSEAEITFSSNGKGSFKVIKLVDKAKSMFEEDTKSENLLFPPVIELKMSSDKYFYNYNLTTARSGTGSNIIDYDDIVVRHSSGQLSYLIDDAELTEHLNIIKEFNKDLDRESIPYLLLLSPSKNGNLESEYENVYFDYHQSKLNEILEYCDENNIDTISMENVFYDLGMSEDNVFFRTDHHWLPQSGLIGCDEVARWLETYGFNYDGSVYKESSYNITLNDSPMLGSHARQVTTVYSETDFLPILTPKYDSSLTVYRSSDDAHVEGKIEETLYDYSRLDVFDRYSEDQYWFYSYGDMELLSIHNNLVTNGKRLLVLKQSFADCMVPYLTNTAEYIDVIDLRKFKGSLQSFMESNKPDAVVMVYGLSTFSDYTSTSYFDFE